MPKTLQEHLLSQFQVNQSIRPTVDQILARQPQFYRQLDNAVAVLFLCLHGGSSADRSIVTEREQSLLPPTLKGADPFGPMLTWEAIWLLCSNMPSDCRVDWRAAFNSDRGGKSWARFLQALQGCGSTLIVVEDAAGHVFGSFSHHRLTKNTQFFGSASCFLFTIAPQLRIYHSTGLNNNFSYLNYSTQTFPNGLGFGGQLRYFGLWLDENFSDGSSKAHPTCSTFASPCLAASEDFKVKTVEVWCCRELPPSDDNEGDGSILDRHAQDRTFLEIAGRSVKAGENYRESPLQPR